LEKKVLNLKVWRRKVLFISLETDVTGRPEVLHASF
jgi:hypothetical protein